jgi:hypothetical protein
VLLNSEVSLQRRRFINGTQHLHNTQQCDDSATVALSPITFNFREEKFPKISKMKRMQRILSKFWNGKFAMFFR